MTSVTAHAVLLEREDKKERKRVCRTLESSRIRPVPTTSGPRVETVVDRSEARFKDVRINLRRRQIGVAKHHLNRPEIGAAFEQVRCERVTDDMRAQRAREAGGGAVTFENLPESHAAQWTTARVD